MKVHYKNDGGFNDFFRYCKDKKISLAFDFNTRPFATELEKDLSHFAEIHEIYYEDRELLPTEDKVERLKKESEDADYILAVGSGTLNDMAKQASFNLNIPCGVFATAASMDGYCSKGAALMVNGFKVSYDAHSPNDILIDLDVVCNAPKIMTAAGFGDIMGKYTCLTDWQLSNALNGEPINQKAFSMMQKALNDCMNAYEDLTKYTHSAVASLMDALIAAGLAMAECGNSRPASGSEHHLSHFLEMDFAKRGEKIPPHGIKVAIGTMVSIEIYNYIKDNAIKFDGCEKVYALAEKLPKVSDVKEKLIKMGCPVRFSEIGVREETFSEMIEKAYTVRDRFTVLTLSHKLGISENLIPILKEKYL